MISNCIIIIKLGEDIKMIERRLTSRPTGCLAIIKLVLTGILEFCVLPFVVGELKSSKTVAAIVMHNSILLRLLLLLVVLPPSPLLPDPEFTLAPNELATVAAADNEF
uniref:Uncharacterized protein n=1 Tax=Glossina pallidipes TaxID=7398 RepID=A0A1B0A5G8_GLOPL